MDTAKQDLPPWRRRDARRMDKEHAEGLERKAESDRKTAEAKARLDSEKKNGFVEQFAKPILIGIVLSVVSFVAGQKTESAKLHAQDERLSVENRRRVFVSSAQELGIYLTQWGRLRSISAAEEKITAQIDAKRQEFASMGRSTDPAKKQSVEVAIASLKVEQEKVSKRKERYIEGRDAAKDKLSGNFEQARLFFGPDSAAAIATFESFERQHGNKQLAALPPLDDWRTHAALIFEKMKQEIRNDESKLETSPLGTATR